MTDQELKDLVAENSLGIRELKELNERRSKENDRIFKDTEKQLKKVSMEIGYLGNAFGRFTEGLFLPSLEKILNKDFGLDTVAHRIQRQRNGSNMELDVLAYSNSKKNVAVVVEIKSRLRDDDINEFLKTLKMFPKFFTEHKDKKIFGMLAAVTITPSQKATLEKKGIYVVRINDEVFRVISDKNFEPKDFGLKE